MLLLPPPPLLLSNLYPISGPDSRLGSRCMKPPPWRGQEIYALVVCKGHSAPPTAPAGHGTLPTPSAGPIASELARHCAAHCPPCRQPQRAILGSLGRSRGVLSIPPSAGSACSRAGMRGPVPWKQPTCGGRGGARREGACYFYALSSSPDQLEVVLGTWKATRIRS